MAIVGLATIATYISNVGPIHKKPEIKAVEHECNKSYIKLNGCVLKGSFCESKFGDVLNRTSMSYFMWIYNVLNIK